SLINYNSFFLLNKYRLTVPIIFITSLPVNLYYPVTFCQVGSSIIEFTAFTFEGNRLVQLSVRRSFLCQCSCITLSYEQNVHAVFCYPNYGLCIIFKNILFMLINGVVGQTFFVVVFIDQRI